MDASSTLPADSDVQDWSAFRRGERITLHHPAGTHLRGVLDMSTADASMLWIHLNDGGGRRLVHRADGYRLQRG